eukprot:g3016.t1
MQKSAFYFYFLFLFVALVCSFASAKDDLQTSFDYNSAAIEEDKAGNINGALDYFRKAVELSISDSGVDQQVNCLNNYGVALLRKSGYDQKNKHKWLRKAIEMLERALVLDPTNELAQENLDICISSRTGVSIQLEDEDDDDMAFHEVDDDWDAEDEDEEEDEEEEEEEEDEDEDEDDAEDEAEDDDLRTSRVQKSTNSKESTIASDSYEKEDVDPLFDEDFPPVHFPDLDENNAGREFDTGSSKSNDNEEESEEESFLKRRKALLKQGRKVSKLIAAGRIHGGIRSKQMRKLCKGEHLKIFASESELRNGALSPENFELSKHLLSICGVVSIEGVLSEKIVGKLRIAQNKHFKEMLKKVERKEVAMNTSRIAERSPGRYEIRLPYNEKIFTSSELVDNPLLRNLVQDAMGTNRIEIDTFSHITSLPKTAGQHWHSDIGSLNKAGEAHLRPHALVYFVPLQDIAYVSGPTEFILGSHRKCELSEEVEKNYGNWVMRMCPYSSDDAVYLESKAGSITIFDGRIRHRGGENRSNKKRALLYIAYVQEWYVDNVNFHLRQTREFDALSPRKRKLLNRVDNEEFKHRLHSHVGDKLKDKESTYNFGRYTYKVDGP